MAYNDVYIGINYSHDGSVAVIHKGKLIHYRVEDRYNREKSTNALTRSLDEAHGVAHWIAEKQGKDNTNIIHVVTACISLIRYNITCDSQSKAFRKASQLILGYTCDSKRDSYRFLSHHESHASGSFYNSGFDEAICLVIDGGGGLVPADIMIRESESIYYMNYNNVEYLYQRGSNDWRDVPSSKTKERLGCITPKVSKFNKTENNHHPRIGAIFNYAALTVTSPPKSVNYEVSGKLMGLSAYGKPNPKIRQPVFMGRFANRKFREYLKSYREDTALRKEVPPEDIAYEVQSQSTEALFEYIEYALSLKPNVKNMCLSGGFFYNVVNNYKILKKFPNINFFFEPIAGDQGTAIGCAIAEYRRDTDDKKKRPLKNVCLGSPADYLRDLKSNEKEIHNVTPKDVAKLIEQRNVVAIYQGQTECGPRALGNRSILYDPRDPDGRDVVNKIKKREWYRPFAGTVLEECAHDWFDMANLKSSPWMMFAVDCYKEKRDIVPALQHNDGTSRIQTVNSEQNKHYYDLISEFYKLTGIPMVLNTSFNLAGDVIVNNMEQACDTCRKGEIPYLYCPEREMLIQFF